MNLEQILNYRRSIRYYSDTKLVDTEKVAHCLRLAQLAPTSSNMQLYEMYHITDKDVLKKIGLCVFGAEFGRYGAGDGGFRDSAGSAS